MHAGAALSQTNTPRRHLTASKCLVGSTSTIRRTVIVTCSLVEVIIGSSGATD